MAPKEKCVPHSVSVLSHLIGEDSFTTTQSALRRQRAHTRPNCHKATGQLCDLPGPELFHLSMGLASQGCCVKEPILGKREVSVGVQS